MGQVLGMDTGAAAPIHSADARSEGKESSTFEEVESGPEDEASTRQLRRRAPSVTSTATVLMAVPMRSLGVTRHLVTSLTRQLVAARRTLLASGPRKPGQPKWHVATVWPTRYSTSDRYPLKEKRSSHVFECCGERWVLEFYAGGFRTESSDHIGLYLRYLGNAKCVELRFRLSIVVGGGRNATFFVFTSPRVFLGKTAMHQEKVFTNWGTARLCPQSCVADPESGLVVDDSLTLRCDIQFNGERDVVSASNPMLERSGKALGKPPMARPRRNNSDNPRASPRQPLAATENMTTVGSCNPLREHASSSSDPAVRRRRKGSTGPPRATDVDTAGGDVIIEATL